MGLLSLKRASAVAGVKEGTIRGAIRLKKLKARQSSSSKFLVDELDLWAWVAAEKPVQDYENFWLLDSMPSRFT